jgi:RHS repeat-associated protein
MGRFKMLGRVSALFFSVFLFLFSTSAYSQGNPSGSITDEYELVWTSHNPTPGILATGTDAKELCKVLVAAGPSFSNYAKEYFKRTENVAGSHGTEKYCVSKYPEAIAGVEPIEHFWKVWLICRSKATGASVELLHCGFVPGGACQCGVEAYCLDGDRVVIGNPVELPTLAKIENSVDWISPLDSRFRIVRHYRSDRSLTSLYDTAGAFPLNLFGRVWQMEYNDLLSYSTVNPLNASDATGKIMLGEAHGERTVFNWPTTERVSNSNSYTASTSWSDVIIDNGQGIRKTLSHSFSFPKATSKISWPDGYEVTIERTNLFVTRMSDNRGQSAEFVYSNAVLPGALTTYYYVSEIVIKSTPTGSQIASNVGSLFYRYTGFADSGPNQPVLAEVDFQPFGQANPRPLFRYRYSTVQGADDAVWPPLLTGISNGSVNAQSQLVYYGEYTYQNYDVRIGRHSVDVGVASSVHAGAVDTITYAYQGDGKLSVTNALGRSTIYDYDDVNGSGRVATVSGLATTNCLPSNSSMTYVNDAVSTIVERNGTTIQLTRNARGYVTRRIENALGTAPRTIDYEWDATRQLRTARQTAELRTEYTYDAAGLMTAMGMIDRIAASPTFNQRRDWTFTYTTLASGLKVLTNIDGPGLTANGVSDVTTFSYTTQGLLDTTTDPNGLVTRVLTRNAQGLPLTVEMPDLRVWTFAYDGENRLISSGVRGGAQTATLSNTFTYNLSDQVTTYTNTRGKTWTFTYDAARRLTQTTAPTGEKATFTLDALGNITRVAYSTGTAAATFWEDSTFDELGRILTVVGAQGQTWRYSHDVEDNVATERDPLNNLTTNAYDGLNRLISTLDRGGFTTGMQYNVADDLTRYTDPRSIQTNFTRNGFGEVITETSADRGTTVYTYNTRGLVLSRKDGRNITVNYGYDNGGRLTLIDYPTGTIGDRTFTYDQAFITTPANANRGHVGRINDGTIRTDFSHQTTVNGPQVTASALYPLARTYTVIERFDFEGNPTSTQYPSTNSILYDVDDANRITRIRLRIGATTTTLVSSISYRPNGPIAAMTYGDTYMQTRTYDTSYRLTGIKDAKTTTVLRNWTYGYNARDNLTAISDLQTTANNETFGYTTREHLSSATGPYGSLGFTYDGVGNRVTSVVGTATDTYTYPSTSNRLSGINLATGGTRAYTYDGAGNVLTDSRGAGYAYTYDAAGRMASMSINGVLQGTYKYDFAGRQAIRTTTSPAITIHSVFDSQGRRIAEYNEGTGALIREYVWLGWEPIAVIEGGVTSLVRTDHIGRPVFATNTTGVKVWTASYTPFGGVRMVTGTPVNARFPGQWFQAESGLHQNWMRDYDPTTGRYLEADPLGLVDGASVYGYARQSPMMSVDPTGRMIVAPSNSGALSSASFANCNNEGPEKFERVGWKENCTGAWFFICSMITGGFDDDPSNNYQRYGQNPNRPPFTYPADEGEHTKQKLDPPRRGGGGGAFGGGGGGGMFDFNGGLPGDGDGTIDVDELINL